MRTPEENEFTTHDDQRLFFRYWPSLRPTKGAIVLFHRGHEHSGRLQHIVDELGLDDWHFFAWDARGHGRSPGERGFSPNVATSARDVDTFIKHIQNQFGVAPADTLVIAQSVGAVVVSTWLHDYAPTLKGAVLASPAFKVKLYFPFATFLLNILQKIRGHFYVNSYVKAKWLTHDANRIASYNNDPLITRPISVNMLLDLFATGKRIVDDAQAITTPVQLLISENDFVVKQKPQQQFYKNIGSEIKEQYLLNDFYHDTLGEKDRHIAFDLIKRFIARCDQEPKSLTQQKLRDADQYGATFDESQQLATPLRPIQPAYWYWKATRMSLALSSKLSKGLELGRQTGFDSGSTLDYIYNNQPSAKSETPVIKQCGELIDKSYLNAIGWRGIRQRKIHIEQLLQSAMNQLKQSGRPINIMDIAAGHGRYILDGIKQERPDSIVLRDYSNLNVAKGQELIQARGLNDLATFVKADAFNTESLATTSPRPTLTVASGLYELFNDNRLINASLTGIHQAMDEGSLLIYTNQPWHPQLAFIARALTSHREGQAWVMRRRTQAEMDQLVVDAGFKKIDQLIDQWGIFTVSLAIK